MPKVSQKLGENEEGEEETTLHGTINEEEAWLHTQTLDDIIDMARNVEEGEPDVMKKAIMSPKEAITMVMPAMEEANPMAVLRSVRDPSCLAVHPCTEETEERLKELMLLAEIPRGKDITAEINKIEPLNNEQKTQIDELFEDMEIVYEYLTCSGGSLGPLSRLLNSQQLLMLLRVSVGPLIQLNVAPSLFDEPVKC